MKDEKVYCPYCGPWNGHPYGVEMREDGNGCAGPERFGYPELCWYYCPACGSESPCETSREKARAAALHRFNPAAAEICDLINQIAYCDYECVAGPLGHNHAFIRLRDLVFDSCGDLGTERPNQ